MGSNRRDFAKITEILSKAIFGSQKVQWFRLPDTETQARKMVMLKFEHLKPSEGNQVLRWTPAAMKKFKLSN